MHPRGSRHRDHVEGIDISLLVHLDQPRIQPGEREVVLPPEVEVALRLEPEKSRQPVELALVQGEVGLERDEPRRHVADSSLERVDAGAEPESICAERREACSSARAIRAWSVERRASTDCLWP